MHVTITVSQGHNHRLAKTKLVENIRTLDEESRRAIEQDREDLAKLALERKNKEEIKEKLCRQES